MNPFKVIRDAFINASQIKQPLDEIREGLANQSDMIQQNLEGAIVAAARDSETHRILAEMSSSITKQTDVVQRRLTELADSLTHSMVTANARTTTAIAALCPKLSSAVENTTNTTDLSSIRAGEPNALHKYIDVFKGIEPFSGYVPKGFMVDWIGALTDIEFRLIFGDISDRGGHQVTTRLPTLEDGEGWFEAVDWVEAARDARGSYTMITLGACYGAQAVGSYLALQKLNPVPARLIAVEPEPTNLKWTAKHFTDNGIDPNAHWLVGCAINDTNNPVFFPVGSPGSGAQNSFSTNEMAAREQYVRALAQSGKSQEALENLLLHHTTGLKKELVPGTNFEAEIKVMSAVTLRDLLSPFDLVDYLEVDIQQSEIIVFPPYMDLVKQKVRRVHLGTHGAEVHAELVRLFRNDGWDIVFDFAPNSTFNTDHGNFVTNDGVLTVRNPNL